MSSSRLATATGFDTQVKCAWFVLCMRDTDIKCKLNACGPARFTLPLLIGNRLGDGPQAVLACPQSPRFAHSATPCVGGVKGINIRPLDPMP